MDNTYGIGHSIHVLVKALQGLEVLLNADGDEDFVFSEACSYFSCGHHKFVLLGVNYYKLLEVALFFFLIIPFWS